VKKGRFLKFVIPIALVVALGIPLMGCWGGGAGDEGAGDEGAGDEGAGDEGAGDEGEGEVAEPIKIGLVFPYSGMFGGSAYSADHGVELAVEDLNAAGGVLGRPVEIERFDVVNWESANLVAARDYLVDQGVDVMDLCFFADDSMIRIFDVPSTGGIPCLSYHTAEPFCELLAADEFEEWNHLSFDDTGRNYGPHAYACYTQLIPEIYGYDYDEYASKTVAIVCSDLAYSLDISDRFRARIAEDPEWEEVYYSEFPFASTEFGVQLTEIRALDPEPGLIMFIEVSTAGSAAFVMQFLSEPTNSIVHVQWGISDAAFHTELGELANGICGQGQPNANPTTEFSEFGERFLANYNEWSTGMGPHDYDLVMGWAEAVETIGDVKAYHDIIDEMASMHYQGYTFGPDGWNICPICQNDRVELSPAIDQYITECHPGVNKGPTYGNNLQLMQAKWTSRGSRQIPIFIQGYPTEEYMLTYYGYLPQGTDIQEVGWEFEVPPYFD